MQFIDLVLAITVSAIPSLALVSVFYPDSVVQEMDIEPYQWPVYRKRVRIVGTISFVVLTILTILGQIFIGQSLIVAIIVTGATILVIQTIFWLIGHL